MITVTLYTKEGCHLCEDAKELLHSLQASYPHELVEIDITRDKIIFERYCITIPVVRIGETELEAPISKADLAAALMDSTTNNK